METANDHNPGERTKGERGLMASKGLTRKQARAFRDGAFAMQKGEMTAGKFVGLMVDQNIDNMTIVTAIMLAKPYRHEPTPTDRPEPGEDE